MTGVILDASAVLAVVLNELGADVVAPHIGEAHLNTVNLGEALTKLVEYSIPPPKAAASIRRLELLIHDFDEELAMDIAVLRPMTKSLGLSLGDRACLASARRFGLPVLTADQRWTLLDLDLEIRLIR